MGIVRDGIVHALPIEDTPVRRAGGPRTALHHKGRLSNLGPVIVCGVELFQPRVLPLRARTPFHHQKCASQARVCRRSHRQVAQAQSACILVIQDQVWLVVRELGVDVLADEPPPILRVIVRRVNSDAAALGGNHGQSMGSPALTASLDHRQSATPSLLISGCQSHTHCPSTSMCSAGQMQRREPLAPLALA